MRLTDLGWAVVLLSFVVVWLVACGVVAYVATQKRRSGFGWFMWAFLLSPLFAVVCLAALPASEDTDEGKKDWRRF
jgi:hypothetical protein